MWGFVSVETSPATHKVMFSLQRSAETRTLEVAFFLYKVKQMHSWHSYISWTQSDSTLHTSSTKFKGPLCRIIYLFWTPVWLQSGSLTGRLIPLSFLCIKYEADPGDSQLSLAQRLKTWGKVMNWVFLYVFIALAFQSQKNLPESCSRAPASSSLNARSRLIYTVVLIWQCSKAKQRFEAMFIKVGV